MACFMMATSVPQRTVPLQSAKVLLRRILPKTRSPIGLAFGVPINHLYRISILCREAAFWQHHWNALKDWENTVARGIAQSFAAQFQIDSSFANGTC